MPTIWTPPRELPIPSVNIQSQCNCNGHALYCDCDGKCLVKEISFKFISKIF